MNTPFLKAAAGVAGMIEPLEQRIAPANLAFAVGIGNSQDQTIQSLGVDAAGNTYVLGTFQGTVDFDPGPGVVNLSATANLTDMFVAKYTSTGGLAWVDFTGMAIYSSAARWSGPFHSLRAPC